MAMRPFKKDLTPIGRHGTVTAHVGKGATEQRTVPGMRESLTGGSPMQRMASQYPKAPPAPAPAPPMPGSPMMLPGMGGGGE